MSMREKFEAWWNSEEISSSVWWWRVKKVDVFDIWQASHVAALEEAALICDGRAGEMRYAHEREAGECADDIRALAKSEGEG